jgi:general secretion pathway protein E
VLRDTEAGELHRAAARQGMVSMYEDGMRKAADGMTSIDEVLRVTRDI